MSLYKTLNKYKWTWWNPIHKYSCRPSICKWEMKNLN